MSNANSINDTFTSNDGIQYIVHEIEPGRWGYKPTAWAFTGGHSVWSGLGRARYLTREAAIETARHHLTREVVSAYH